MSRRESLDAQIDRLPPALNRSLLMLRRYREKQYEMVDEFCGQHWGPEGAYCKHPVPVNLLATYVDVTVRNLISQNPRVLLSTTRADAKPVAAAMQDWVNKEIQKTRLDHCIERVVTDACFRVGVCKVAIATPTDAAFSGWNLKAGHPFARPINLDDLVVDMHARHPDEFAFIGHRYRAIYETVVDSSLYDKSRKDLQPMTDRQYNLTGDPRINLLGRGFYDGDAEEFEKYVDLWEIYLPRFRLIVTLADSQLQGPAQLQRGGKMVPLRVQEWIGPDCGPYHWLGFGIVPGNCMPKSPLDDLFDLHLAINQGFRKAIRQMARQKENPAYARQRGGDTDAGNIQKASDGEWVPVDDPKSITTVLSGQVNQAVVLLADHLHQLFNDQAGNLALLAGTGPQSKTATQDQMLSSAASAGIQSKQKRTLDLTVAVVRSLLWYYHHHPTLEMSAPYKLAGLPDHNRVVTPEDRFGISFDDLDIQIDPYSLLTQTPQQRAQAIMEIIAEFTPLMTLLQQQGISFDMNTILTKLGAYRDMPDLPEIMTVTEPPPQAQAQSSGASMPASGTRTYERVSRSQETPQKRSDALANRFQAAMQATKPNGMVNR